MELSLLDGERLLHQSPNQVVSLTTHRVRLHRASGSAAHIVSMMLEKVSSCEIRYLSHPWLLLVGALLAVSGVLALFQRVEPGIVALLLLVGGGLLIAYFASRHHVVSITSDGGTRLSFETKGMQRQVVIGFIDHLEQAKDQRMLQLSRGGHSLAGQPDALYAAR
ncbi:hypothetical protein E4631_19630 [Hymenobacter sp. UV11]|jgi:hypothetical protein|uniref:hypothetical protein n=1 Tax=Hymenobacter sp. UV11 TaxID=1849735 RepID=UPI00105E2751|nr:hypothetical protein [Hymenobacter sp. UV11]TDN37022.1 hypothetical protein A8B98_06420 [Hymenobacter sp. UV11]TFZ64216.1 hypothetical protein E4631_19630 [Hymenobacter sp. UV11]